MRHEERIRRFVEETWQWYVHHQRILPWRDLAIEDDTQRAYPILVSEVMLQQTQVSRVQIIFKQFIERFPTIQDLAKASNRDVLIAWRGMGYNSRALRLRDAARTIMEDFGGVFPREMDALLSIKGIGPYTAAAIRNFAFNLPTPCIDTNIRRILHRTFIGPENPDGTWKKDDAYLLKLAGEVLRIALEVSRRPEPSCSSAARCSFGIHCANESRDDEGRKFQQRHTGATWHSALMDFGSLVQTKSNPKWYLCPLTAAGIMKATRKSYERAMSYGTSSKLKDQSSKLREPGRQVGGRFVPNRIFRGKVVDLLRDHPSGLTLRNIGREVCIDWEGKSPIMTWMKKLLNGLQEDGMVERRQQKYLLLH